LDAARLFHILFCGGICVILLFLAGGYIHSQLRPVVTLSFSATVPVQSPPPVISGRLNINTATLEELDSLPGIGPHLANAIMEYRQAQQGFFFPEELMNVPGIGQKRFDALRPLIYCPLP